MFRKLMYIVCFMWLVAVGSVQATTSTYWLGGGSGIGDWDIGTNWDSGTPTAEKYVQINSGAVTLNSASAAAYDILIGGSATAVLSMLGGTLTVGSDIVIGDQAMATGTLNVIDGNMNVASSLIVGQNGAAIISLSGGTISCNALTINSLGLIDIANYGILIVNGDVESDINIYIASKKIVSNGRVSTVAVDYNVSNPWKTTVKAGYVIAREGDLNCDYMVDYKDLAALAEQWLQQRGSLPYAYIAPVPNGENAVNFLDFADVGEHWLENTMP